MSAFDPCARCVNSGRLGIPAAVMGDKRLFQSSTLHKPVGFSRSPFAKPVSRGHLLHRGLDLSRRIAQMRVQG